MNNKIILHLIGIVLIALIGFGCDDYSEEDYGYSELESAACQIMQDSLVIELNLTEIAGYDSTWIDSNIYSNIGAISDSLIFDILSVITQDSCYLIETIDVSDSTAYFNLSVIEDGSYAFFFNHDISFELVNASGQIVTGIPGSHTLDAIAASAYYYTDPKENRSLEFCIMTSLQYELSHGNYLAHINKSEAVLETAIKTVILKAL
ncbi:MAG: hypothetical protein HQ562_10850 [Candidatus Marinimicrobia bacterium]|nr:hypothetical protein [Candidatus Neomarinimicrobiota bacterium]